MNPNQDTNVVQSTVQNNPVNSESPEALAYITEEMYKKNVELVHTNKLLSLLRKIDEIVLSSTMNLEQVTQTVVDSIFTELGYMKSGYEIIMLTLLDKEKEELKSIATSHTQTAEKFLKESPMPYTEIVIPLWAKENILVKAISNKQKYVTDSIGDLYVPIIDAEWVNSFNTSVGIKTSIVYPLIAKNNALGVLAFTLSKSESEINEEEWKMLDSFVGAVGIALDNALLFKSVNVAAEQLKQANERLQELDKLKDEFLSIASHELRTPMTVVKDYVSLMLDDQGISSDTREKLNKVYNATQRLIALVNDNLDISRIESGKTVFTPTDFDISKLAVEVRDELSQKYTSKKQKLEVQVGNYLVHADRDKIHQVLLNLMDNAVKFTQDEGNINVTFNLNNKIMEICVSDNGPGVKAEDMNRLFGKFERLSSAGADITPKPSGTGLGLYLSKTIIDKSGGTIKAESEIGKGTKFIFTLPVS